MPFLKSLVDTGASGVLMSTIPALTPPAWAAFQTGTNPGKTGVFCFTSLDRATRANTFVSAEHLSTTLWETASAAGKRVVVLNLPMSYPPRPLNGCMVTGLMTPSMKSDFTWPAELKEDLLRAVPGYHIFNIEGMRDVPAPQNIPGFVAQMVDILENRVLAAEYLINAWKPDLCMVHFQTSDIIQHALWCFLDPGHKNYDSDKHKYILEHFYRQLDKSIQRVHASYTMSGPVFDTLVISDHGFEAYKYRFNLATWLYQQGLLVPDRRQQTPPWPKRLTQYLRVGRLLRFLVSQKSMAKLEQKLDLAPDVIDWRKSSVYVTAFSSEAGIYIMEQDPVRKEAIATRIIDGVKLLKDPRTGEAIVEAVYRSHEIYHGPRLDMMPDLVVVPISNYMCNNHYRATDSLVEEIKPEVEFVVGRHHPEGIIVGNGPDISGRTAIKADIIDVAPTVLYMLGLDVSADCDGHVIMDMFTSDFVTVRGTPRIGARGSGPEEMARPAQVYSADDEQEIQKKLRDLGYI
jgi:predicted AlkP superfamily phosphohydrolase/phosphomutase